jgi:hypothetical protein
MAALASADLGSSLSFRVRKKTTGLSNVAVIWRLLRYM